jgi:hypothetical protein
MTRTIALLVYAFAGLLGLALVKMVEVEQLRFIYALPLVVVGVWFLLLDPFRPLFLLVLAVPLDGLANRMFSGLPISPATGLTLLTFSAIVLKWPDMRRSTRLQPLQSSLPWLIALALTIVISAGLAGDHLIAALASSRVLSMMMIVPMILLAATTQKQVSTITFGLIGATLLSSLIMLVEIKMGTRLVSHEEAAVGAEWEGITRSSGASDNDPTTAAMTLGIGVVMAMTLALEYPRWRAVTVAAAIIGGMAVVMSYARSAALTCAAIGLFLAWRHRGHRLFPLGLVAVMAVGAAMLPFIPDTYWTRMGTLGNFDSDYTLWRRLGYNIIGLDLLSQHPLFGIGPGNFLRLYMLDDYRFIPGRTLTPRVLHNLYLGVAVELGLIGLAPFLGLIGHGLLQLRRAIRNSNSIDSGVAMAVMFGFLAFLVGSVVTPAQFMKLTWVLIGLVIAQAQVLPATDKQRSREGGNAARNDRQ